MRASLARLALFLLPVAALLLLPLHVLWRSGELLALRPESVLAAQREAPAQLLFGPAFSNCSKRLKLLGAREAAAEVLVLGSSRSMHFRAGLFPQRTSFYNAGGGASRVGHLRAFLEGLPANAQPKVLVVGLDQWWFNARTEADPEPSFQRQAASCDNVLNLVQRSWRTVYADLYAGKFDLRELPDPGALGLNAIANGNGFRNDGSYVYGRFMRHPEDPQSTEDWHYRETYRRISSGTGRFAPGAAPDPALLRELGAFLDAAKARGIHVVGFLPPFAPPVNARLADSGRYAYMAKLPAALQSEFARRGDGFFDFTDLGPLGVGEDAFIDGVHAAERAHGLMLEAMLSDPQLAARVDADGLRAALARSPGTLSLVTSRLR
jgi:hypothetical protein